jgi:hypothetical protein
MSLMQMSESIPMTSRVSHEILPSPVRECVARIPIEKHNTLAKLNSIHRDAQTPGLSLDTSLI